jgi:HPt (histidine-containing phosphotransfer) domain-containing protein
MLDRESVVNWDLALDAVGGDRELLKVLCAAFLEEGPTLLQQLRQAIEGRHTAIFFRAAHTLKGSLRFFGNQSASELAALLEIMARRGTMEDAPTILADLESRVASILTCLSEHIGHEAA